MLHEWAASGSSTLPAEAHRQGCRIEGARTHTLKGISCTIPFGAMTVITGVSGSGKSTLAFDTLYAEGQRRFVDCLSTYARQFLQRLDRPDVDRIGEIQPPIALRQQVSIRNARSTVGSITELSDLLHLVFTHAGEPFCPGCGTAMQSWSSEHAADFLQSLPANDKLVLTAPLPDGDRLPVLAEALRAQGYERVYDEGQVAEWSPPYESRELVIDRFTPRSLKHGRAGESLREAWRLGMGRARLYRLGETDPLETLVRGTLCPSCGETGIEPRPHLFSSNSPLGACDTCNGFGRIITINRDKVIPDQRKTLADHAVVPFSFKAGRAYQRRMVRAAEEKGVPLDKPFRSLTKAQQEWVFRGSKGFSGVEGLFRALDRKRYKTHVRIFQARFRGYETCPDCAGSRRRREALAFRVGGHNIHEMEGLPLGELRGVFRTLELPPTARERVASVLQEVEERLGYLEDVGLGYLTLARTGRTLSGGETQRIRLASGLGTSLTRTMYVLDEPTVGLHAADTQRMLTILHRLCDAGNTVVVVEHDPEIVAGADHLLVLGPSGGDRGGELLYEGPVESFLRTQPEFFRVQPAAHSRDSLEPRGPATPQKSWQKSRASKTAGSSRADGVANPALVLEGVEQHNLRIDRLKIPLAGLVCVTGVSGSGKSTLVEDVIHRNALRHAGKAVEDVGRAASIDGFDQFDEVLLVAQNPLGRSTRSNVITFTGLLSLVRTQLAKTPAAKERKLGPSAFSFNVEGGRCEACKGMGTVLLEMHFMADVEVTCEACRGQRFREVVLEVTWAGRNILQLLDLTVEEALGLFEHRKEARDRLGPLIEVGLGYLKLGQNTSTLSGGEAQRLKIAALLAEGAKGRAARTAGGKTAAPKLFLLDEPTSGLHPRDISALIAGLRRLLEAGHGVIVVEHQLDFIRACDWVVDLGPGGGDEGGRVVFSGPPSKLASVKTSVTGRELARTG